jgi:hypothetical protein
MKLYIGIQDGVKEGFGDGELSLRLITTDFLFTSPAYMPYWIAEVTEEIWANWNNFVGPATVNYTGLNHTAWEVFWDTFTRDPVLQAKAWLTWKKEHLPLKAP